MTGQLWIGNYALVSDNYQLANVQVCLHGHTAWWSEDTVTTLSVTDASRKAGVSRQTIYEQISRGELKRTSAGIELIELMQVYPDLANHLMDNSVIGLSDGAEARLKRQAEHPEKTPESQEITIEKTVQQAGTVELLVRELEWNKELLEQTNQLMARQLAEQRALIADQARRLDEKDRFWARQVEIAQSLLPAPAPRKKFLGLF